MLKGIHRQVVEITDTGSPYFERAWLVVRPGCADAADDKLREEANRVLRHAGPYSGLRRSRRLQHLSRLVTALLAGGGGALLSWLLTR